MYKPCSFDREDYLELADEFEAINMNDASQELTQFGDDAEDLAFELAYTRYALSKKETETAKLKNLYDSMACLFAEGVEFMTKSQLYDAIKSEWKKIN